MNRSRHGSIGLAALYMKNESEAWHESHTMSNEMYEKTGTEWLQHKAIPPLPFFRISNAQQRLFKPKKANYAVYCEEDEI